MKSISRSLTTASHLPMLNQTSPFLKVKAFSYSHYGPEGIKGKFRILPVSHTPALQTGLNLMNQRPLALLGISLGNPFFTRRRIEVTVCAMAHFFDEVTIVIPDAVAMHTYRALGYDEHKVRAKARTEGQTIKNRCLHAIELARRVNPAANLRILDWARDIYTLPGYWDAYAQVCRLFDTNGHFQKDVLDKGYAVLRKKLPEESITLAAVRECIKYLLEEFAYLLLCRTALGRDLVIPYHLDFALGQGFCDGAYQEPLPGVGCLIFEIELAGEAESLAGEASESMLVSAQRAS